MTVILQFLRVRWAPVHREFLNTARFQGQRHLLNEFIMAILHAQQAFCLVNPETDCIFMLFEQDSRFFIIAVTGEISFYRLNQINAVPFFVLDQGRQSHCIKVFKSSVIVDGHQQIIDVQIVRISPVKQSVAAPEVSAAEE